LAHNPAAAGSERAADRKLALPLGGAGEEQVGNVRAGNQEDQPNRSEQHKQGRAHFPKRICRNGTRVTPMPALV